MAVHVKGLSYLVVRDTKTGKLLRVTEAMAKAKLGEDACSVDLPPPLMATIVSGAHAEAPAEARGPRAVRTQAF